MSAMCGISSFATNEDRASPRPLDLLPFQGYDA